MVKWVKNTGNLYLRLAEIISSKRNTSCSITTTETKVLFYCRRETFRWLYQSFKIGKKKDRKIIEYCTNYENQGFLAIENTSW